MPVEVHCGESHSFGTVRMASPFFLFPPTQSSFLPSPGRERRELSSERAIVEMSIGGPGLGGTEGVAFFVNMLGRFFPHGHADAGPSPQGLSGFSGL